MPPPANFSNFGRSGGTAALTSRSENFASTAKPTPPPLKVTPPVLRPPAPNTDFSNQNKNIPSDCPVELKTDSATGEQYCPVDQGDYGDEQGYDRDQYDNPYDYDPSSDYNGSATQAEANAAAELAKQELNDVIETSKDIGKYLSMADAAFSLANLGNALLNGIPLANQANTLNADANALKAGAFNLQSNLNSSINTLNQGIANRNMGQIQDGFNGLQAAQNQASQLQAQGQSIQQRANDLQGKAATYQRNTDMLQGAAQVFGYGAQGANLFGQGYQAATQPSTENYTNFGASLAQTALKAAGDFTSLVSPIGAQVASGGIGAGQQMFIQAGRGASPTDIGLAATNFFGGSAYSNVQQGVARLDAGDTAGGAGKITNAFLDVVQTATMFSPVAGASFAIPPLRGLTEFGVRLAQGADLETAGYAGANVTLAKWPYGKIASVNNLILNAQFGDIGYLSPDMGASALAQTIDSPLVTTRITKTAPSYSSRNTGYVGFEYNPSAAKEVRDARAYAQQITGRVTDTGELPPVSFAAAIPKLKPILDKYGIPVPEQYITRSGILNTGIAPANFAKE
jgi:hypothetical protein